MIDHQSGGEGFSRFPAEIDALRHWPEELTERYRPAGIIGRGGRSVVFSANCRLGGFPVAVKVPYEMDSEIDIAKLRKILEHEGKMINKARGTGVVKLIEYGGDGRYLVLEELSEESFHARFGLRRPPVAVAVSHVASVAETLGWIHSNEVLHLDTKPRNLLFSKVDDSPVLVDFGSSRPIDKPVDRRTIARHKLGSGKYLFNSPEQLILQTTRYSSQTDAFGLGCTLCWLLFGRSPFSNALSDEREALSTYRFEAAEVVSLCERRKLPSLLCSIVEGLLRIDCQDRLGDMYLVGRQLGSLIPTMSLLP